MTEASIALQVVSANDLQLGHVVYLTDAGGWTDRLQQGRCLAKGSDDAQEMLVLGASRSHEIVGAYLIDVERGSDGTLRPTHYRERIRLEGPGVDAGRSVPTSRA